MQQVHPSVFQADGSRVFGKVAIGEGSSIWFNAVIRCETREVRIGRYTNLQDFTMIHVGYEASTTIGDFCTLAHRATVHGATVGDACLIGIGATLMDGAEIGAGSIVAGGAVVTEGQVFPEHSIIVGTPAKAIRERDSSKANRLNAWKYHRNAQAYLRGEHRAWEGKDYEAWLAQKVADIEAGRDL